MADFFSGLGSAISSVVNPLAPVMSLAGNLIGGADQNASQQRSIQGQEDFQERMSDTAYQRSVADMTKAGLNPALMYGSGGPESTPSGASGTPPNNVLGTAVNSAFSSANQVAQIANTVADTGQKKAQTKGIYSTNEEKEFEGNTFRLLNQFLTPFLQKTASSAGDSGPGIRSTSGAMKYLFDQGVSSASDFARRSHGF